MTKTPNGSSASLDATQARARRRSSSSIAQRGMTLIEIIIVLIIISLVMSWLYGKVLGVGDSAKASLTAAKIKSLKEPLYMYQMKNNSFPADAAAISQDPQALVDAWGRPIQYRLLEGGRGYEFKSLGADGKDGGTGINEDIVEKGP